MEKTNVQKLAKILKILVTITFICNLLILPLVPGIVGIGFEAEGWTAVERLTPYEGSPWQLPLRVGIAFLLACWQYLFRVWRSEYTAVLTLFLLACGVCTALILRQAQRVLDTILEGNPFQKKNGTSMKRAAGCCFVISAAALLRTFWRFWHYGSIAPLFTYNALFIPLFAMGGLLCMVMSALFRQAAELKEENDLTI
ncbi:MAG: DUF2975 domain-containing protein [Oscillospiraceae bacterium]|jgi:hypothetical protein|nr:DUF2975 domain-containing protein [Oscillospiraceae bacterium]